MPDTSEREDRYRTFIRMVHAIESNKESLQSIREMAGFSADSEQNYAEVITMQERMLKEMSM
jgi:hypothetical protein